MKPYRGGQSGRGKGKRGKKSRGRVVDAFGSDGDAPKERRDGRNSRPSKSKQRQERSALGFVVAAAVAIGGIAMAVLANVKSRKESDCMLRSMRKKPLTITEHAACRYVEFSLASSRVRSLTRTRSSSNAEWIVDLFRRRMCWRACSKGV
jgi:hypothetical protein